MSDGQTLFAVFALLYLIECLRLVPATAWMAAGAEKQHWSTLRPWTRFQIGGGSPLLLAALPPMKGHTLALPWLFVPEEAALRVRLNDAMTVSLDWDKLRPHAEESTLHLDSATRVRLSSPARARIWQQRLLEWRELRPEQRRSAFLKHARTSLDIKTAETAATEAARHTRPLRLLATLHFIWCFAVITVVYRLYGDGLPVLMAALTLLLLQFTQSWLFLRATSQAPVPYRRWRALGIAFLPQLAMRAFDAVSLTTDAEPPHPLAWHGLLEEQRWLQTARQFWREARYVPGWPQSETLPVEAEALQTFFRLENIAKTDYAPQPTAKLPACPRCGAEYQVGINTCTDCGGVELLPPTA